MLRCYLLRMKCLRLCFALVLALSELLAQDASESPSAKIVGRVVDGTSARPVEYVTVELRKMDGTKMPFVSSTDGNGAFALEKVPVGEYVLSYGSLGQENQQTASFKIDATREVMDFGQLTLTESSIKLEKVEVSVRKEAFYNSIDRKVFNVGKDLQSLTGSASDLLQNIPSVQVDIEGNVSLRGAENVLILINGKSSTLMGANRAAVLEQLPADSIEKIEVITNPSAKYKPDGTGGIINITLKKTHEVGYSGNVRATVGNHSRYNASLTANFNPGKYNIFGTFSVRQDYRPRYNLDTRTHIDAATNQSISTEQRTEETARPLSTLARTGVDYKFDDQNKLGATVNYNHRSFERHSTIYNVSRDANGTVTGNYDRIRVDPEYEKDLELTAAYQHSFATDGQELSLEFKHDKTDEQEDNSYTNVFHTPAIPTTYDKTLIKNAVKHTEAIAEYMQPIGDVSKLETGYTRETESNDMDFYGSYLDPATGSWVKDTTKSNRFIYDSTIHALYGTWGRPFGDFGASVGLRFEQSYINTNQVTAGIADENEYFRIYPTLHTSYNLTETEQLQLNYSHRVRRPESDDLNPFPEYQDPFNLRAGNPDLMPEEIHSIEFGYQYKKAEINYLATTYYRYQYHSITEVSRYINSTTLLTTKENLESNRSAGLELAGTRDFRGLLGLNLNANLYRNEIDASNLGYSSKKSTFAWSAKLGVDLHASKRLLFQFNANYTAKRLTPQGYRMPTFVANGGMRYNFADKKTAFVFTVSDIFNSLEDRTVLDTPTLHQEVTRRRSARIIYAGFIYNFGKGEKKAKDEALQFDNSAP